MANAPRTATNATTNEAAQQVARVASQRAASEAMNNSAGSPWVGGLPFSSYDEVYNADGSMKTFLNKKGDKIAGRMVRDAAGVERKLYNAFLNLMVGIVGVTSVTVEDEKGTFYHTQVKGAKFGVFAVTSEVDTDQINETTNKPYKRIDHSLQKTAVDQKPAPATV